MIDFEFIPRENPIFRNKQSPNMEKSGKIQFMILVVNWLNNAKYFRHWEDVGSYNTVSL
jgi:hypothetical protein